MSIEERVSVQQLFDALKKYDSIEFVFIYEISRLSRQPKMLYEIRDVLIEHRVNLYCLKPEMTLLDENFNMSQTASIMFSIFASLSESEAMLKKERCMRGMQHKKKLGLYAGGNIPLGYKVEKERFVVDPKEAKLVRQIFNDYIDGKSVLVLAKELRDMGYWNNISLLGAKQNILNLLHREGYYGQGLYPAIITKEIYDKAREKAKRKSFYHKGSEDNAIFRGLIKDVDGYTLTPNIIQQFYFRPKTTISYKVTNIILWGIIVEWYNNIYDYKRKEIRDDLNNQIIRQQNIVTTMEKNITENNDKIDRIEERYIEGFINKDKANELERKIFYKLQMYKSKLDNAKAEIDKLNDLLHNDKSMIKINNNISFEDKKKVCKYIVEKIVVKKLSFYIAEISIENKITGEIRKLTIHTRKIKILKSETFLRPSLNYLG